MRYENPVAARFLLDMLTGNNSLGAEFGRVAEVAWQARDKGWLADDLAISCKTALGKDRAIGISVKSDEQVTASAGFPADFVSIAWRQWLGRGTERIFTADADADAMALITAGLTSKVKADWSALLSEALQTSPDRTVSRLQSDASRGSQSSRTQRALFQSFRRPEEVAGNDDLGPL